ncbi:MAG: 6-phosphogluconolactonase [Cyanobacteria bacterium P01_D01_bin.36]
MTYSTDIAVDIPIRTLTVDSLTVHVYPSANAVAVAASSHAADILRQASAAEGEASAVFATGRSQKQCLSYLTDSAKTTLDWQKITGFHLDEYLGLSAAHPASFRQYFDTHLTSKVNLKAFHEICGDELLPIEVCEQYEQKLRARSLNLCFLGIGNNGHLAFNDPDVADFSDPRWVKLVRLDEVNRQQQLSTTAFDQIEAVPQYAFTLTLSALKSIQHNLCLAFGEGKSEVVRSILTGPITPKCPASILRQIPQSVLMLDTAAAELI